MKLKTFLTLLSIIVFGATVGVFIYLWQFSGSYDQNVIIPANLQPVEVQSLKSSVTTIVSGLEKQSDFPISAPEATPKGKMGRDNPFSAVN